MSPSLLLEVLVIFAWQVNVWQVLQDLARHQMRYADHK
jgi:hypothetical protein